MGPNWTKLEAAAAVIGDKSNLRTIELMVDIPSVQGSLQWA